MASCHGNSKQSTDVQLLFHFPPSASQCLPVPCQHRERQKYTKLCGHRPKLMCCVESRHFSNLDPGNANVSKVPSLFPPRLFKH